MKKSVMLGIAIMAGVLAAGQASAGMIGLTRIDPDIASLVIGVDYDASADVFSASGMATSLTLADTTVQSIAGGTFDLSAMIDGLGAASGGTLTIGGTIPELGYTSGTLLTGSLVAYGTDGSQAFEFLFTTTGGDAAALFSPQTGVILNTGALSPSLTWSQDFSNDGFSGTADAFLVPEPATVALLALGGLAFAGRRRR